MFKFAAAGMLLAASLWGGADPNYTALREALPRKSMRVEHLVLKRDTGLITLEHGLITFLAPVLGKTPVAVFNGEGKFEMKEANPLESAALAKYAGSAEVAETFDSALFYYSDGTDEEIRLQAEEFTLDAKAGETLKDFRNRLRHEDARGSYLVDNLDAEILAELYNPLQAGSFRAFFHGKKFGDLRWMIVPRGAIPELGPEEVGLFNGEPGSERQGIWSLTHRESEFRRNAASSTENKRIATAQHYSIHTTVQESTHLSATTEVTLLGNVDGARVVPLDLVSSLRVASVTDGAGRPLNFVQEPPKQDPGFYVVLAEPLMRGASVKLKIAYEGDKVVSRQGNGNFSVGARAGWYPNINSFKDRATYDLSFRVPKQYTVVGVGKLQKEGTEGGFAVSEWKSEVPLAVAGFNYGLFKKRAVTDKDAKYDIEVYSISEMPTYMKQAAKDMSMSTAGMVDRAIADGQNSMRIYQRWFGDAPYGRIALTQQPKPTFGQSWPSLVYLPLFAFLDFTQRAQLLESDSSRFNDFVLEVTPHEIAHQWWGHMVGWASYHDQWLSEGFAEFSAALFVEATKKPAELESFWERLRQQINNKNQYGQTANEAGPIWMGLRLNSPKNPGGYRNMVYPKGAYVLHMLRMLMHDDKSGDENFIAMMKDFVASNLHKNASTENFQQVAEKHMTNVLDVEGNQKLDWFFREWVYGSDMPKYRLEYSLVPAAGGTVDFVGKLTQSSVSDTFAMRVPLYFDIDGKVVRGGFVTMKGNSASPELKINLPKKPKRVLLNANHDVLNAEAIVKAL